MDPRSTNVESIPVLYSRRLKAPEPTEVTELLLAWSEGDKESLDRLLPVVYRELHRMARRYMVAENPGHTLQASALVNEAYLKLVDVRKMQWQNRAQFFGVAAERQKLKPIYSTRTAGFF